MSAKFRPQLEWKLPLSGNVSVPVAMPGSYGGQFGLFNINLGGSGDPGLEQALLDDVGSYGRQLGRICDVIDVLLLTLNKTPLDDDQRKAIDVFEKMSASIKHTKLSNPKRP